MRSVICYSDISMIENHPDFELMESSFHITDTKPMAETLNGMHIFSTCAVPVSKILSKMFGEWRHENTKFSQIIATSRIIKDMELESSDDKRLLIKGFRKNYFEVYSAIRVLMEAGINLNDLRSITDPNIEIFSQIWGKLIEQEGSFARFDEKRQHCHEGDNVDSLLEELFGTRNVHRIVFHNFYFITPIQELMIRSFEERGIEIFIAGPISDRHTFLNNVWTRTLKQDYGYPAYEKWSFHDHDYEDPFGDILQGHSGESDKDVALKAYDSVLSFANDMVRTYADGWNIVSPDTDMANGIISALTDDVRSMSNFLSYPVGRYISALYDMWDDEDGRIILDADILHRCFSSGWMHIDGIDARQYMRDLDDLLPYFKGCRGIDDWQKRIDKYADVVNNAVNVFVGAPDKDRRDAIMGNPLRFLSMFSLPVEDADRLFKAIGDIISVANSLFDRNECMNVKAHLSNLKDTVFTMNTSEILSQEELAIIRSLQNKIDSFSNEGLSCYPSDISLAISDYLGDKYVEEDGIDLMVKPLDDICGIIHSAKVGIHLCLCDLTRMPGSSNYVWPLNKQIIDKLCSMMSARESRPLINHLRDIVEEAPSRNRYLMGLLMRHDRIVISWIRNMDDKPLNPSPYVSLLMSSLGIKPYEISIEDNVNDIIPLSDTVDLHVPDRLDILESRMDRRLCMMRYIYGFTLSTRPVVRDEFLQSFCIDGLIKALNALDRRRDSSEYVLDLFPNLLDVQKRQMMDFSRANPIDGLLDLYSESPAGTKYTNQRLRMYYASPKNTLLKEGISRLTDDEQTDLINADPKICSYCPHRDNCIYVSFRNGGE